MPTDLITKRLVDVAEPQRNTYLVRDTRVKGFVLVVTAYGGKSYAVEYRAGRGRKAQKRRYTIGKHVKAGRQAEETCAGSELLFPAAPAQWPRPAPCTGADKCDGRWQVRTCASSPAQVQRSTNAANTDHHLQLTRRCQRQTICHVAPIAYCSL